MPRYKLTLEYDGGPFVGWQAQDNGPSVQAALEEAVRRYCGETVLVQGAGRTDAGVHATGQVAHVDLHKDDPADRVMGALNHHLKPLPIVVLEATVVGESFHARFSATGRAYRYAILNRPAPPALEAGRVWWLPKRLDTHAMHEAAQVLVGYHDFSSFRAAQCQAKSPLKTLDRLTVRREAEHVVIEAAAQSFLHNQVRAMVGTLALVGQGRWTAKDVQAALKAHDRRKAGPNAPPQGLYLTAVRYEATASSPATSIIT